MTDDTQNGFGASPESAQTPTSPLATFLVAVLCIVIGLTSFAIAFQPLFEKLM